MAVTIGALHVRRSIWIAAAPERVWQEFTSLEAMQSWFGTGHTLEAFAPEVGARVVTSVPGDLHGDGGHRFEGTVVTYDAPRELSFEQDWVGHGWAKPMTITLRLSPADNGTLVELFHHGFEALGADAGENHRGFEEGWTMCQLGALADVIGV